MNQPVAVGEKSVPRVLFEILIYGHNDNKKRVQKSMKELQEQITNSRAAKNRARVLWYLDSGEKTDEEKKTWLKEHAKCKYYVILDGTNKIEKSYVKDMLKKIRLLENAIKSTKSANICVAQKTNNDIEDAKILDIQTGQP